MRNLQPLCHVVMHGLAGLAIAYAMIAFIVGLSWFMGRHNPG